MAANTAPIFTIVPFAKWGTVATANTAMDGTGTVVEIFEGGTEGSFLEKILLRAMGTNVATVARIWLNNGSTNATAANNTMVAEITLPATTASANSKLADNEILMNMPIPPSYKVYVTIGTTVAAGYHVTGVGGKY